MFKNIFNLNELIKVSVNVQQRNRTDPRGNMAVKYSKGQLSFYKLLLIITLMFMHIKIYREVKHASLNIVIWQRCNKWP
jgi:hypothetical protein